MAGKGRCSTKIARNATTAIARSAALRSEREPMRHAACSTMAVTAGLMP
jgi:hypothetical protein